MTGMLMSHIRDSLCRRLLGFALLGCASAASAANSMNAELRQLMPLSLDELINVPVVTASRQTENRDHTPAHIIVITREQIRERRYRNLADLLEDLPGVDMMRGTKSSAYNNFTMQGSNSNNKVLIMLDGIRIDHPSGGKIPVAENFALFPAKQVEILFGPAASLYGADAVAGVINIITDAAGETPSTWAQIGAGSFEHREASFMAGFKTEGKVALSVGGHIQRADRADLDKYYPDDFPKVDARTFSGNVVVPAAQREDYVGNIGSDSLIARLDVGDALTFGYYRNGFKNLTSTGDTPESAIYLESARWITRTDTAYGKYRFDLTPTLSGELVVDYSAQEVDPKSSYVNIYTDFADHGYDYVKAERLAIEQNLNWKMDATHSVQAGLGYRDYSALETPDLPHPYNPDHPANGQGYTYVNTDLPIRVFDAHYHNASIYAQIQSDWSESFNTMLGVRHDRHSDYASATNPRLGAVWRPNERHSLKLLYGESFRAPSPEESLSAFGSFSGERDANGNYLGSNFRVPNSKLEPEEARTLSLTWDWRPRPDTNVLANLYHGKIDNLIVTLDEAVSTQYIPGALLSKTSIKGNAGEETHTGLDLMAQWRFRIGDAWSGDLWGSYSYVDGRIREGANQQDWDLSYIAENKFKLGATFRYLDRVSITPRILSTGDTSTGRKDRDHLGKRITTAGYTIANLHIGWHKLFGGRASAWLDIYNLNDKRYYAAHGSASTTFVDMPQAPRNWVLSLEYRF
jgi:outer membrane receptor for ferrienterochelin and colicins